MTPCDQTNWAFYPKKVCSEDFSPPILMREAFVKCVLRTHHYPKKVCSEDFSPHLMKEVFVMRAVHLVTTNRNPTRTQSPVQT